ncbi:uncharacterized protein LOC111692038 [Anoplophora glabripennis]|uniref:uncharacterized protein LOC111692038 n=1 Tax=Anoplophora glabripennis TaxID=217634 RepID=UPI000C7860EB|nr:uncharacterized protein LOC111692038 [Anoplophora glabripennis]
MVYHEKLSAHIRLCDKHFEKKCFKPFTISPLVLHRDAIPTLFPAAHHQVAGDTPTPSISTEFSPPITVSSTSTSMYELMADTVEGTSKQTFISDTLEDHDAIRKTLIKPSLFKGVQRTNSTEEKRLTSIIKKKDRYLRKLKKKCRERGCRIKDLSTNIQKFIEVNHIFKGMSPPAAQFMISQIRCSGRPPHGRTWTLDDKVFALAIYKRKGSIWCWH